MMPATLPAPIVLVWLPGGETRAIKLLRHHRLPSHWARDGSVAVINLN